jgi:hypothetical protein
MGFGWQDLLVYAAIVAAVVFLLRRLLCTGTANKPSGCGGCSGCVTKPPDQTLVSLESPRRENHS